MIEIRSATSNDIDLIARVHIEAFQGFFLTKLGLGFLSELYKSFLNHPDGILLVAVENNGRLVGFVAGTVAPERFFSDLRRDNAWGFLRQAIPALLKEPLMVLAKLYSAFFYAGDKPSMLVGAALLSSIGVSPRVVGRGVGQQLLAAYENIAFGCGASLIYLTTDAVRNNQVNKFYICNGYVVESKFIQGKSRTMLRYIKEAPIVKILNKYEIK